MKKFGSKSVFSIGSLILCSVLALTTGGCASGGFKLTRQYAGWVNSQMIILRIVIYLLTGIVFAVTLLIDMVIFNTMDFWEGRVSEGNYQFKDGDKTYQVQHEFLPGTKLKRSTIRVMGADHTLLQEVVLNETTAGEIEMFVDGKVRARVRDISAIPVASVFDEKGNFIGDKILWFTRDVPAGNRLITHAAAAEANKF